MWCYELLMDNNTEELVFGYNLMDACRRAKINNKEIKRVLNSYYED